jgi:DNA-binding MarR family transcriptional regulator
MEGDPTGDLAREAALGLLVLVPSLGRIAEDAARAEAAISTAQASHLATLLGGPLRGVEIAERNRTSRASVAEVVQRLEAARLVRSVPDPRDGRARLVELTPAGHGALVRFGEVTSSALARVLAALPPETLRAIRDGASAVAAALSVEEGEP